MAEPDLVVASELDVGAALARIRSGRTGGAWLDPWGEGVVGLVVGRRFALWSLNGAPDDRVLPRSALMGRVDPAGAGCRIQGRFRAPAPDAALVVPGLLFSLLAVFVFGFAGIAGIAVVVVGWGVPARWIAARSLERDALALERWLRLVADGSSRAAELT